MTPTTPAAPRAWAAPLDACCALRLGLRWAHGYPTHEGSRFGCAACGRVYRRRGFLWVGVDPVVDILDLIATHPLSEGRLT